MNIKIGPVDNVVLLGGGKLLSEIAVYAKKQGFNVLVLTAPRHAVEKINNDNTLFQFLEAHDITTKVMEKLNEGELKEILPDVTRTFSLSLGAAWIFTESIITNILQGRLYNCHSTLLPLNRGGGGFSWQIMKGNRLGACSIHIIDGGIDTGEILFMKEFLFPPTCRTPNEYANENIRHAYKLICSVLDKIKRNEIEVSSVRQPEYLATYWPRLNTEKHSWINWTLPIEQLDRFICAFDEPYAGAQSLLNGEKIYIKKSLLDFNDGLFHPYQYGLVYRIRDNWISIAANCGTLIVQSVMDKNGNNILDKIQPGDRFVTPLEKLETGLERIFYDSKGLREKGSS